VDRPDVRRVLLDPRSGEVTVGMGRPPILDEGSVLIQTSFSVISPGTERSKLELASTSLLGKARSRPDLVRQVIDKARKEGIRATATAVKRQLQEPMSLGYSLAGTAIAVGQRVTGIGPGDLVAAGGGGHAVHADVVAVPQNLVVRVPDGVTPEWAALTTLGAVSMHGFRLAEVQVGSNVVVLGLGLVGVLAAAIAKAAGCRIVGADLNDGMVERARGLGLHAVSSAALQDEVLRQTRGRGADAVLVCAATRSAGPLETAGQLARDRAKVVVVGDVPVQAPRALYFEKEIELVVSRSYGPGRYDPAFEEHGHDYPIGYVRWTEKRNMESFLDLLAGKHVDVEPLVERRFPADRAAEAYEMVKTSPGAIALLDFGNPPTARPKIAPRQITPSRRGPRIGLIGTGSFASRILVPALKAADAEPIAIVSQQGRRPGWAAEDRTELIPSIESLLARSDIDAVVIASRHDSHAGLAVAALEARKAVFVEKPLALSDDDLTRIVTAYGAGDRPLQVGFNRRFAPLTRDLASHLHRRVGPAFIGIRVNAGPLPADHWLLDPEVGGGRILGEMCHFIDLATFLIGAFPTRVMATAARRGSESPQTAGDISAGIEFSDGSCAQVSYVSSGEPALGKERLEAFFDGTTYVIDDWHHLTVASGGRSKTSSHHPDKGHNAEIEAFIDLLTSGRGDDGFATSVASTRATLAVVGSAALGVPVDL
ncbi:MAG: bi-domain-containing oxidoreductase, partial [Actinomycetota bacterium]